jgi:hypothetical protein
VIGVGEELGLFPAYAGGQLNVNPSPELLGLVALELRRLHRSVHSGGFDGDLSPHDTGVVRHKEKDDNFPRRTTVGLWCIIVVPGSVGRKLEWPKIGDDAGVTLEQSEGPTFLGIISDCSIAVL